MKVDKYKVDDKKKIYESYINIIDKYFSNDGRALRMKSFLKGVILGIEIAEESSEE